MTTITYHSADTGEEITREQARGGIDIQRTRTSSGAVIEAPYRDPASDPPPPRVAPVMTTLDFMRLFTAQEVIKWNAAKAAVAAMTPQDYEDPNNAAMATFSYFNALFVETNTIDTSRADLQAGLDILIAIGVIASDRKAAIIAGVAP